MQSWYRIILKKILLGLFCVALPSTSFAIPGTQGIQIYQRNMHLSEAHKQKLAADIYRYNTADNIWDELRRQFVLSHYDDKPEVQAQIAWFISHPDFLLNSANRAAPYLYYILQQVRLRHLPAEIVLLPMIESAYNPFAYSTVGAAGIWQMMPGTASGFGIKQDWWYDGRRDVVASTRAALDFLSYLGNFFEGNWLLAIAAYDTGEGNILAAIRKNIRDGKNTNFWSLPVAQETRTYIPRLMALAIIISHPEIYPIRWPVVPNAPYLAQIDVGAQMDLKSVADIAGLSLKKLKQLNSGYNRATTDPHGPFKLVLPIENVQQFTENLSRYNKNATHFDIAPEIKKQKPASMSVLASALENLQQKYTLQPGDTLYMVRNGDDLQKISERFHLPVKTLQSVNQLTNNDVAPGSQIIIPTHVAKTNRAQQFELTPGDTIYMVKNGDTVENIAEKFHTSPAAIRLANLLSSDNIKMGDRLVIPVRTSA